MTASATPTREQFNEAMGFARRLKRELAEAQRTIAALREELDDVKGRQFNERLDKVVATWKGKVEKAERQRDAAASWLVKAATHFPVSGPLFKDIQAFLAAIKKEVT